MANPNFLKLDYRTEGKQTLETVGIVDGDGSLPAYTTVNKQLKWNATILNKNE